MKDITVIVFGDDFHNTYGVIRSLGEAGINPFFINVHQKEWSFVEKSKYIKRSWRVSTPDDGIDILTSTFGNRTDKPVIICTSDKTVHAIDERLDELKNMFVVPNADMKQGKITCLMDKNIMRDYARQVGFDLTNNISINPSDYNPKDIDTVLFPCFVKPTNSLDGQKSDMRICSNKDELVKNLKELSSRNHLVEVQDYIKKDVELLLMGCVLNSGEVVMPLFWRKKREDPNLVGNTAWSECTPTFPNFDTTKVQHFFDLIKYHGIFSMEFLSKGDKNYFLEVNLRNDGNGYGPTYGGVNLPLIWVLDAKGEDVSQFPRQIKQPFHAQIEFTDFMWLKKNPQNVFQWLFDTARTECFMVANKQDPEPWNELLNHGGRISNLLRGWFYKILVNAKD